jgi:hypothetical protein
MTLLWCYALLAVHLVLWFGLMGRAWHRNVRAMARLPRRVPARVRWPRVCAIVPARNEERALERALRSLLAQDYPNFVVVCANDGSTDRTGAILQRLAGEFPHRLVVTHVPEPPPGWMGKTHAQWHAVRLAPADATLLLFTDADVEHAPDTLRRAVAKLDAERADLLAIFPVVRSGSLAENAALPVLMHAGLTGVDLRGLNDPRRRVAVGIGAFTLLRRGLYERWGGHEAIRGEVIDDIALGVMTKRAGGRLVLARDPHAVQLRMYHGLWDLVRGFEKNVHTAVGGGVVRLVAAAFALSGVHLMPLVAAAIAWSHVGTEAKLAFFLAGALALATGETLAERTACFHRGNPWATALGYPLGVAVALLVFVRSAWHGAVRGRVRWRGRTLSRPPQQVRILR